MLSRNSSGSNFPILNIGHLGNDHVRVGGFVFRVQSSRASLCGCSGAQRMSTQDWKLLHATHDQERAVFCCYLCSLFQSLMGLAIVMTCCSQSNSSWTSSSRLGEVSQEWDHV